MLMKSKKPQTTADYRGARLIGSQIMPEDTELLIRKREAQKKVLEQAANKKADEEIKTEAQEAEAAESFTLIDRIKNFFEDIFDFFDDIF